jgi:alcohol dehydrogenase class IV
MQFELATAARVVFRPGAVADLPGIAREFGTRALLVTGRNTARAASLAAGLQHAGIELSSFAVDSEPTLQLVRNGVERAGHGCNLVIGFGGGSTIDAGKAIAALTTNSGEPLDYLEIIGKGRSLERPPLPFIAVPTTAGTGAEVTRNAVLDSPEHGLKASLRSAFMLPKAAVIDPDLTLDLPPEITASTGLDALTQLIEAYVSKRANALADLFCLEGIRRASQSLLRVWRNGGDHQARESMSFASLLSGLALANAGLGVVHGFAAPLGAMLHAPHSALCAAVLPHGIAINIEALRQRARDHDALRKYREIARILTGDEAAQPENGADWIAALCQQLSISRLRAHGLVHRQIPELVEKTEAANSTKGNPIPLTADELTEIAERAL